MGALKKRGFPWPMFNSNFNKKKTSYNSSCNSIRIGWKFNFYILGAWWGIWKWPLFGTKEEDDDSNNIYINKQQNNKSEKVKGRWVFYFFKLGFVLWWVFYFSIHSCQAQKVFEHVNTQCSIIDKSYIFRIFFWAKDWIKGVFYYWNWVLL